MSIFKLCMGGNTVITPASTEDEGRRTSDAGKAKRRSFKSMHRIKPVTSRSGAFESDDEEEDDNGNVEGGLNLKKLVDMNRKAVLEHKKKNQASFKRVANCQRTMGRIQFGPPKPEDDVGRRKSSMLSIISLGLFGSKNMSNHPPKGKFITSRSLERQEIKAKLSFKSVAQLHKSAGLIVFRPSLKKLRSLTIDLEPEDEEDDLGLTPKGKLTFKKLAQLNENLVSIRFNKAHGDEDMGSKSDISIQDASSIEENQLQGAGDPNIGFGGTGLVATFLFNTKGKMGPEEIKKLASVEKIEVKPSDPLDSYRDNFKHRIKKVQHLKLARGYKSSNNWKRLSKKTFFQKVATLPSTVKNWQALGCCWKLKEQIKTVEKIIADAKEIEKSSERELLEILPKGKALLPKDLSHSAITQIKSIRINPPGPVQVLMAAICVLKRIKPLPIYSDTKRKQIVGLDYWTPSKKLLVGNFSEELREMKIPGIINRAALEDFRDIIYGNPEFNRKKVSKCLKPLTEMYDWLIKLEKYAEIAVLIKEKEDIRQLAERTIKKGRVSIERMKEKLNSSYS